MSERAQSGPVDLDALLARVGGNMALLRKLAVLFVEHAPRMQAQVRAAVARHDEQALREAVHDLRGSVGLLTGHGLAEAAARVEELFRAGRFADAEVACAGLDAEFERFTVALKQRL